jgi:hypothetical protein
LENGVNYLIDLGPVEEFAVTKLNGTELDRLWTPPYCSDFTKHLKSGENRLEVEITSTRFNRLLYDARQPEEKRKSWVITRPDIERSFQEKGLRGAVTIYKKR